MADSGETVACNLLSVWSYSSMEHLCKSSTFVPLICVCHPMQKSSSTSMILTFPDTRTERQFASQFALRTTEIAWVMNVVMATLWISRLAISYQRCYPQGAVGCSVVGVICAMMCSCHQCTAVLSWYRVGWGMDETGKARYILCDLTACMVLVILARNHVAFPVVFSPVLLFTLHGWAIPFAGCRVAVNIYLHGLNMLVLMMLMLEQHWSKIAGLSLSTVLAGVTIACILPGTANVLFEARCRVDFMRSRGELHLLNSFWSIAASMSCFLVRV